MLRNTFAPALFVLLSLLAGRAVAGPLAAPAPTPDIFEGEPAGTCEWAAVPGFSNVLGGICSAVLIHPQMIATAGHCAELYADPSAIWGESINSPHTSAIDQCWIAEGYTTELGVHPDDVAFCRLTQPVDLPYFPPAFGCEIDSLTDGAPVVVVGFGEPDTGIKNWRITELLTVPGTAMALLGDDVQPTCGGDSGGPALIELADGSWRTFGVISGGGPCGATTFKTSAAWLFRWVPWAELQSGLDLTPCHDPDGTWNPTPACQGFVIDPMDAGNANWHQWCAGAARSELGESCGPAAAPDDTPPSVSILSPADDSEFSPPLAQVDIEIAADDGPWPVSRVELLIEGEMVAVDPVAPWGFAQVEFPTGSWSVAARAIDVSGNVGESQAIDIHVGDAPPEPEGETGEGEAGESGETGETGGPALDDPDSGCACTSGGAGTSTWALGLLLLVLRRRGRAEVRGSSS